MIYESKLNYLSEEELCVGEIRTIDIMVNRIKSIEKNSEFMELEIFARKLAKIDTNYAEDASDVIGVYYRTAENLWCATRKVGHHKIWVGSSRNKEEAEQMMIDFSRKNGLQVYK